MKDLNETAEIAKKNTKIIASIHRLGNKGPGYFGAAIRKMREFRGWKVFELADRVGVAPVYITQIEKHNQLPATAVMERISKALHDEELLKMFLKYKYPAVYKNINVIDLFLDKEATYLEEEDPSKLTREEATDRMKRWKRIEIIANKARIRLKKIIRKLEEAEEFKL